MFKKNTLANIHFPVLHRDTGIGITSGTVSISVYHDGVLQSSDTIIPGTNHLGDGFWFYEMITSAMNADSIGVGITHANSVPHMVNIKTVDFDMTDLYTDTQSLVNGVSVTTVGSSAITGISDFYTSTAGLSTFDHATDFVTLATSPPDVNVTFVNGVAVTDITDFHASTAGITATVTGTIDANLIQVGGITVSDISDFYTSTAGLSTFDYTTDMVNIATNAINAAALASSGINEMLDSFYASSIDSSITMEQLTEMLLAWMAGKTTVVDNGSTRTLSFYRRDGVTVSFSVEVSETDSEEGSRSSGGTIV